MARLETKEEAKAEEVVVAAVSEVRSAAGRFAFRNTAIEEKRKQRHRRVASLISRNHICPLTICGKSYG